MPDSANLEWLQGVLAKYENKPSDGHRWGLVESVAADGSYNVRLNSSSVLTRCSAGCTASVGDVVFVVIKTDGECVAVSRLGGERLDENGTLATLHITGTGDASGTAAGNPPLIVGNASGAHIAIDTNEVMAKSGGTTPTTLFLNYDGGAVYKGADPLYGMKALYGPASTGTNGTVTLAESAANFAYFIVVVGFSDTGAGGTIVVPSPNGKTVDVGQNTAGSSYGAVNRVRYKISGTAMTVVSGTNYQYSVAGVATANVCYCKCVIGLR